MLDSFEPWSDSNRLHDTTIFDALLTDCALSLGIQNVTMMDPTPSSTAASQPNRSTSSSSSLNRWALDGVTSGTQLSYSQHSALSFNSDRSNIVSSSVPDVSHSQNYDNSYYYSRQNTARTIHDLSTTSNLGLFSSEVVMSIVEGRGKAKGEVGLAYIDLRSPILYLAQFVDNCTFDSLKTKCHVSLPLEIIFPHTLTENNIMMSVLVDNFPNIDYNPYGRKFFNEKKGLEYIQNLCYYDYNFIDLELEAKYYCLAACSALLSYITTVKQIQYAPKSLKIVYQSSMNTMIIDPISAKLLELIINLSNPKSPETLFGTINRTKTKSGYVLLRSNILQPLTDLEVITQRLDMVEAISSSVEIFNSFETVLTSVSSVDLDQLIVNLVQLPRFSSTPVLKLAEKKIEYVIHMKHVISLVDHLKQILVDCNGNLFKKYIEQLQDSEFKTIKNMIDKVINGETKFVKGSANMKLEKCFAIKDRINALLDLARGIYSEMIDDLVALVKAYEVKYNIKGIRISNSSLKGFILQIRRMQNQLLPKLPLLFCDVNITKKYITFTTDDVVRINNRIKAAVEEIYLQSDHIVSKLIDDIRSKISCFYNLTDIVANIDLMFSFAYQCSCSNYIRPNFSNYIDIRNGIHPVLDKITGSIANSIQLSEDLNFHIITGPNMGGKTTFLKQIALLQIMAQIGSFVPAELATFRICDKLFTRMALNDNLQMNSSSFILEVKELNYILNNFSSDSLILIDELGRGSTLDETFSVYWKICESLLASSAFTIFATHFVELTSLSRVYLNVTNYHFVSQVVEENFVCKYPHILFQGPTSERFYGIQLAEVSGLDSDIVEHAKTVAAQLQLQPNRNLLPQSESNEQIAERRAKYRVVVRFIYLITSTQQDSISIDLIRQLQLDYEDLKQIELL